MELELIGGGTGIIIAWLIVLYHRIRVLEKKLLNGCISERLAKVEEKLDIIYKLVVNSNGNKKL